MSVDHITTPLGNSSFGFLKTMEMWTAVTEQSKCVTYVNERCVTYVSGLNTCPYKINGYIPKRTAWIYVTYEIASLRSQRHYFQELLLQEKGVIRESPVRFILTEMHILKNKGLAKRALCFHAYSCEVNSHYFLSSSSTTSKSAFSTSGSWDSCCAPPISGPGPPAPCC